MDWKYSPMSMPLIEPDWMKYEIERIKQRMYSSVMSKVSVPLYHNTTGLMGPPPKDKPRRTVRWNVMQADGYTYSSENKTVDLAELPSLLHFLEEEGYEITDIDESF
jgi:hypothetical protein